MADPAPDITIDSLADHPDHARMAGGWVADQWGWKHPDQSRDQIVTRFVGKAAGRDDVPCAFVALVDGVPVGTASLWEHDMDSHPHLSPWLAAVIVIPERRHQGIGSALVRRVLDEAAHLGIATLYLYTPDMMPFYSQLGWTTVEETTYQGEHVAIMSIRPCANGR